MSNTITYECGCTMARASIHHYYERDYVCGVHKSTITPPSMADKVQKLGDPAFTPDIDKWVSYAEGKAPVTTVVNGFNTNERNVLLALCAMRQYELLAQTRQMRMLQGPTFEARMAACESENATLGEVVRKLQSHD